MSNNSSSYPSLSERTTLPSGASYPTALSPLTFEERLLLETHAAVKSYEREAARLKAEEAKRRLVEADQRYRAKMKELRGDADDNDNDGDDNDGDVQQEEQDEAEAKQRRRDEELSRLRRDVAAAKEAKDDEVRLHRLQREKEEALRQELLGEQQQKQKRQPSAFVKVELDNSKKRAREQDSHDDNDELSSNDDNDTNYETNQETINANTNAATGPSIKKKQRTNHTSGWDDFKPQPSLIANLSADTTPPHEFSKQLKMSSASSDGTVLFPRSNNNNIDSNAVQQPWTPPPHPKSFTDRHLELQLFDFHYSNYSQLGEYGSGNNTLAVKFYAPEDSERFSVNIARRNDGGGGEEYRDVLFHFNPRHYQRGGQLVINDKKEGMWGNDISVPLSTLPLMFGKTSCTLIVQINQEGFDVFIEGKHCARLEHRTDLSKQDSDSNNNNNSLYVQFPSSDDYGNPENWRVYRVWWGRKPSMASSDLSDVAGVNLYSSIHPKKLFVSGLLKLHSDPEVDLRRAELERAFRKYGGPSGVVGVIVPKDSTFAFVECDSEQLADLAVMEMAERYKVNKARRTKREALMEERAAKEAKEKGFEKESGSAGWD